MLLLASGPRGRCSKRHRVVGNETGILEYNDGLIQLMYLRKNSDVSFQNNKNCFDYGFACAWHMWKVQNAAHMNGSVVVGGEGFEYKFVKTECKS